MRSFHDALWVLSWFPRHIARFAVVVGIVPLNAPRFAPIALHAALHLFAVALGLALALIFSAAITLLYGMPIVRLLFEWACYAAFVLALFRAALEAALFAVTKKMTDEERRAYREMREEGD